MPPLSLLPPSSLPFPLMDSPGDWAEPAHQLPNILMQFIQSNSLIKSILMFNTLPGTEISVYAEFSHCWQNWYYGLQAMYSSTAVKSGTPLPESERIRTPTGSPSLMLKQTTVAGKLLNCSIWQWGVIRISNTLQCSNAIKHTTKKYKKLSYRRETARQLPMWRGLGPPAHSPSAPSGYTYAYGRIRKPQRSHNLRTLSVPSTKRTLR